MNPEMRRNLIEVCSTLAEQENLKVTITSSAKGALYVGAATFIGGVLGGPLGMAAGGVLSSLSVAFSSQGKFKSVVQIIAEMSEEQQVRLATSVQNAIKSVRPEELVGLLSLVMTNATLKEAILLEIGSFLKRELEMQMIR
ncbi:protein C19orf12 homolog [Anthonomus grandis grandis]|uniref:protein C19orf12 homolog n=1 Tax=Anthonomus grandis grandis TaxID=2921223 RepID=UPI00216664E1|nr:protein C19orf12 homolog [Anthonomus grandis grandis]